VGLAPTNQPTVPAMHIAEAEAGAGAGAGVQVGALPLPTQPRRPTPTVHPKGTCLRVSCSASLVAPLL
jgi:hypothetical protein